GWLFEKYPCPNFFGEIVEWLGFAMMCSSLGAWSFFIWTCANLIPRALAHHRWYQSNFENYPTNRKAVLPGVL
ncbi:MAG: 3-oxo-5-alpha-steroid 4-dehydrogenase, partial [Flammeovirgaceae bacterium]|nr:3-oxo-5-alpha-steroid 4-dehydrogenase [Flammeovirgaceae bacterium]